MNKVYFLITLVLLFLLLPQPTHASQNASASSATLQTNLSIKASDNRAKILEKFLDKHSSPLKPYSSTFIKYADHYGLDWRLVVSIAGIESAFGKYIPYNSHNAWGWGIYGNNAIYFSSWEEGIKTVSKGLRENYIDKGATNIYQIGRIYAVSPRWPGNVIFFIEKIRELEYQNQITHLSISL